MRKRRSFGAVVTLFASVMGCSHGNWAPVMPINPRLDSVFLDQAAESKPRYRIGIALVHLVRPLLRPAPR